MKILFIGGTGLISSEVSALAVKNGFDLYLLNRGTRAEFEPAGVKMLHGDINDEARIQELVKEVRFDAVVNWIVFEKESIERDIRLFAGKTAQYILISTVATYAKPPVYYFVDESTPQRNPISPYATKKIACEQRLMQEYRENGFPATIVRPSHTYGKTTIPFALNAEGRPRRPWTIIDRMLRGKKVIVPGDGTSLWTLTHNSDFARGLVGLLGNTQAIGQSFHITSDEVKTWDQYLGVMAQAVGAEPDILHVASESICRFMPEFRGGLMGDTSYSYIADNSKIKRFVPGYVATMPFERGIRESIGYFSSHPELQAVDEVLNERYDRFIELYESFLGKAEGDWAGGAR